MGCVPFDPDYACDDNWDNLSPELQERATDLAWATMRVLTGGQLGNCKATVRPCLGSPCGVCLTWANGNSIGEVYVGHTRPDGTSAELWYDDDGTTPTAPRPPYSGSGEVRVTATDPDGGELWFDPYADPYAATPQKAKGSASSGGKDEVRISSKNPGGGELWFDTDADPATAGPVPAGRNPQPPSGTPIAPPLKQGMGMPFIRDGEWYNAGCGCTECSCTPMCEIVMPGPVAAIAEVLMDGCPLPLEWFRIDNGNRIVRMDGGCWPSCQNMGAPLGAPGTLGITYLPGILPNSSALWAAGVLASEFSKACQGEKCRLPSSVTSLSRQGVNMTMGTGMWEGGKTGIKEVDAFLLSVNPHGLLVPPMVWSPDVPWVKHRYETPTGRMVP